MSEENVYQAPEANLEGADSSAGFDNLASRWSRLFAAIIDSFLIGGIVFGIAFATSLMTFDAPMGWTTQVILFVVFVIVYIAINGHFLSKYGQTVGKRLLSIKVVMADGSPASFSQLVFVRYLIMATITQVPFIGSVIGLVDSIMIFGEKKQTLHDRIANTKVINE